MYSKVTAVVILGILALAFLVNNIIPETFENVEPKPFTHGSYYTSDNILELPDYKRLYQEHNSVTASGEVCEKDDVPISTGYAPYQPESGNGFLWLWALKDDENRSASDLIKTGTKLDNDDYVFSFEENDNIQLISIADGELNAKSQYSVGVYPSEMYTKGVHISYAVVQKEKGTAFRITYKSMSRWWLCADKESPDVLIDDSDDKPLYHIGYTIKDRAVHTGTVLGFPGRTGVPSARSDMDKNYLVVQVEAAQVDKETGEIISQWGKSNLEHLYSGTTSLNDLGEVLGELAPQEQ